MQRISPFSKFLRNVLKTVGASGVQFLITLCTTPIMTRLFDPTAYATFGMINGASSVIVGIGLLSLPNAYTMQKDPSERTALMQTMLILLAGLVILAVVAALFMSTTRGSGPFSTLTLMMLPLLVLTLGIRQILTNIAIQRANFTHLSFARIIEPVCSRGGSVALGAGLGGHPIFILGSVMFGYMIACTILLRMLPRHILKQWRSTLNYLPHFFSTLRRFPDFTVFSTISQQVLPMVMLGIQMIVASSFSTHTAGQYILAISILTLPITLIALATAPVTYHHFLETERTIPSSLARNFLLLTVLYSVAGLLLLLPILFFGEMIFKFAFGAIWADAGHIAAIMSIPYMLSFALTGVQSIFMVTGQLRLQFKLETSFNLILFILAAVCFKSLEFNSAITCLAALWLLRNGLLLATCVFVANRHSRNAA